MRRSRQLELPENWVLSLRFWVLKFSGWVLKFWCWVLGFWAWVLTIWMNVEINLTKKPAFAVVKCNFMLLTWLKNLQNGTCVAGNLSFEQKSWVLAKNWAEFWNFEILAKLSFDENVEKKSLKYAVIRVDCTWKCWLEQGELCKVCSGYQRYPAP